MLKRRCLIFGAVCSLVLGLAAAEPVLNVTPETYPGAKVETQEVNVKKVFFLTCGNDAYIPVKTSVPVSGGFTFSAWYEPDGIPVDIKNFAVIGQKGGRSVFAYGQSKRFFLAVKLQDGQTGETWSRPMPSDRWYHIAAVCDAGKKEVRLYVNGKMEHANSISALPVPLGDEFNIGCADPDASLPFWCNGLVNEAQVYNRALSESEIARLFTDGSKNYPVRELSEADLAAGAGGPFQLLPVFDQNAVSEDMKARLKRDLPGQAAGLEKQTREYRAKFAKMFGNIECLQKERIGKRMEIVDELIKFIGQNLKSGTNDGLMYAYLGVNDLKFFQEYFRLELEAWEKFPRFPQGDDPGNNPVILNAADFGVKGDGETDDALALAAAFAALKNLSGAPAVLRIPAGSYYLENWPEYQGNMMAEGLENAIIEGDSPENTKILFGRFSAGINLIKCRNVSVRNLMLQYKKTPFLQGDILSVDVPNNTLVIQHDPATLKLEDPIFGAPEEMDKFFQCATAYTQKGILTRSQFIAYNERKYDDLGGGKYRIYMDKRYSIRWLRPGLKFVLPYREGLAPCFVFSDGVLCSAEGIHIRNSRGAAFQTWGGWWCSWSKCKVYPLPGLFLGSNSDFLIASDGSYASHCEVINPGDDCFNPHTQGFDIQRIDGKMVFHDHFPGITKPGQLALVISKNTGQYMALAAIAKPNIWIGSEKGSEFETPLPDTIRTKESGGRRKNIQGNLVFRNFIRYEGGVDDIYQPHVFGLGSVMYKTSFKNMRSGVVIQAPCSLVEDCTFEDLPMGAGITVSALIGVHEGPNPYCVIVRNNKIKNAHFGLRTQILCQPTMGPAGCPAISGIIFENNVCENTVFPLYLRNLGNSVINGLKISGKSQYAREFGEKDNSIWIERCANVNFSNVSYLGKPLQLKVAELIQSRDIQVK